MTIRTNHPCVVRRVAKPKQRPKPRGPIPLRYLPFPEPGAVERIFREAQQLGVR